MSGNDKVLPRDKLITLIYLNKYKQFFLFFKQKSNNIGEIKINVNVINSVFYIVGVPL